MFLVINKDNINFDGRPLRVFAALVTQGSTPYLGILKNRKNALRNLHKNTEYFVRCSKNKVNIYVYY